MKSNIILIGFMGTGKTTIGGILSKRIEMPFIDTDALIEKDKGMSISDIFKCHGEKYFREIEHQVITSVVKIPGQIVATGGGAVMDPDNFSTLKANGITIALLASLDTLWNRLKDTEDRPLMSVDNPKEALLNLYLKREPVYKQANYMLYVDDKNPQQISNEIIKLLMDV